MNQVSLIKNAIKKNIGFDVVIIVSSNNNSNYWKERLKKTRKKILPKKTKLFCVEEKWKNKEGAGQLLGTLNAFLEIQKILKIEKILKNGGNVAIYHTAGKGKRMAPLCGTEKNNKPAIKIPAPVKIDKKNNLLSILELVILSTQFFAKNRKKRVCVFWGDQISIPSKKETKNIVSPIEIFGIKKKIKPIKEEWEKNWKNYGILIKNNKEVIQREKLKWENAKKIIIGKKNIFQSTGCFSVSLGFIKELIKEFRRELISKEEKLDIDNDLWMPLTSNEKDFLILGGNKKHWKRINIFKKKVIAKKKTLIKVTNLGEKTIWWDYGNLFLYYKNVLKIIDKNEEGKIARGFFGIEKFFKNGNIVINSKIKGEVKNCVILNSEIEKANIKNSIVINSKIKEIKNGNKNLLYYVREKGKLSLLPEEVITDVKIKKEKIIRMKTKISRNGKEDWKVKLPENPFSYSKLEKIVANIKI